MSPSPTVKLKINFFLKASLFCALFTGIYILVYFLKTPLTEKYNAVIHAVIGIGAAFFTTYIFLKSDKKSFASIGFVFEKETVPKFFKGILLGIGIMGTVTLLVIVFSHFTIEWNPNSGVLVFLWGSLPFLPLAFMEEVGFRAYPFLLLRDKTSIRNAILLTSLLFGLYHVANGWTLQNSLLGAGVWGIIFGLTAQYSNGISMPTGLHYAVNVTTSAFGIGSNSYNLFVLKQRNGGSLENYQSSQLADLLPQISLLVFGVLCMEWYVRRKRKADNGI